MPYVKVVNLKNKELFGGNFEVVPRKGEYIDFNFEPFDENEWPQVDYEHFQGLNNKRFIVETVLHTYDVHGPQPQERVSSVTIFVYEA
jgi:hypothetical protein